MCPIAESLHRLDLTEEERDEHIRRYADLIGAQRSAGVSRQFVAKLSARGRANDGRPEGAAKQVAEDTGVSVRTVQRMPNPKPAAEVIPVAALSPAPGLRYRIEQRPSPASNERRMLSAMLYLAIRATISGVIIAIASMLAKRYPGFGALVASLPLVSILGMVWLWNEKPDPAKMAAHASATFWYVLPSLPMFLLIPSLLRHGFGFWTSLTGGCALTIVLYTALTWIGPRFGLQL